MRAFAIALLIALAPAARPPGATPGEHRVKTADGVELWYRVAGVERGLPVLFLHGGPGEGSQVMQALGGPALEKRVRMVYLDERGSGRSERPKDPKYYSWALLDGDVELIRRQLGVDKIVLLSHSAGTPIALNYAANHPEHVAGVILAGAVPDMPAVIDAMCDRVRQVHPELYFRALAKPLPGRKCDPFAPFKGDERQAFNDSNMFPDSQVRDRVNWLDGIPGVANSGALGGPLVRQGLLDYRFSRPERLAMPILFIAGGRDYQTTLGPQHALARKVRDGRVIVYPRAGHFMFADDPQRFAADVSAFVAKVSRR